MRYNIIAWNIAKRNPILECDHWEESLKEAQDFIENKKPSTFTRAIIIDYLKDKKIVTEYTSNTEKIKVKQ